MKMQEELKAELEEGFRRVPGSVGVYARGEIDVALARVLDDMKDGLGELLEDRAARRAAGAEHAERESKRAGAVLLGLVVSTALMILAAILCR